MKPLIVLLSAFLISLLGFRIFRGSYDFYFPARIAMSAMLLFTALGHFMYTQGMTMMMPDFIPFKVQTVYVTGIIEIAAAIGLFIPNFRIITAWLLIAFLILILPVNIYASIKHIDYQKGTFDGNGLSYLWFRIPLQILFIVWIYLSSVKH